MTKKFNNGGPPLNTNRGKKFMKLKPVNNINKSAVLKAPPVVKFRPKVEK